MQKEFLDNMSRVFGEEHLKTVTDFNTIASKAIERIARENINAITDVFTSNVNHMQEMMKTKKVEDVLALQSQFIRDNGSKVINYAQKSLENLIDVSAELNKFLQKNSTQCCAVKTGEETRTTTGKKS